MHGEEIEYVMQAYQTNWMSTVGENINVIERLICEKVGCKYAVALSSGTSALHLAVKLAGVKPGDRVFCSDLTFNATVNPVIYEKGAPVFIYAEYDTWNMDPKALEKAFEIFPGIKVVIVANLYGTPAKFDEIRAVCEKHGAVLIEDAAGKARKWSTQSREDAPWYQHREIGYNYRMSNLIAGVVRGQIPSLEEHIAGKKGIYQRYKESFKDLPVTMNPYDHAVMEPNFWLSCILVDKEGMCRQVRGENRAQYLWAPGKSCPTEIFETLAAHSVESRPVWKPMYLQPVYRDCPFITREGIWHGEGKGVDVSADIFDRGLCLPSDIKMAAQQQGRIIGIVKSYFRETRVV